MALALNNIKSVDMPLKQRNQTKKNIWNMKVTVIPIVVGALGTIPKGLIKRPEELEIRGQVETIQTTALLISTRIPRRVLGT